MQIDGHHGLTYVTARIAGFSHEEAGTVAYAAQYVDDATNDGPIVFENSEFMYYRIASAHKMIDYGNFVDVSNHLAWLPFHFLPGNCGKSACEEAGSNHSAVLQCKPDSHVARDMLRMAIKDHGRKRALHRLGITMHVYADTFAHQGFVGALNEINRADNVTCGDVELDKQITDSTQKDFLTTLHNKTRVVLSVAGKIIQLLIRERKSPVSFVQNFWTREPLGHAKVDVYPDLPYIKWKYKNWQGEEVCRDNLAIFLLASERMVQAMRAWRAGDEAMTLEKHGNIPEGDMAVISSLFQELKDPNADNRHAAWINAIKEGKFSFGKEHLDYIPKGTGSWKETALGTTKAKDTGLEEFPYSPSFLDSDWKLFHDALQVHRTDIVHEVLPRYGICAA